MNKGSGRVKCENLKLYIKKMTLRFRLILLVNSVKFYFSNLIDNQLLNY
jgi:hypothetical protein